MDDFNKGKLLRYICDNSGVTSKDIGRITVQRMHSYFDIESDSTSKLDGLKNLEYGGRAVRVNRDSDGGGRDKRKGKRDGGRDKRGGGKPRFKR
jgi:ATP-dependent RNA helicase DeaD